MSFTPTAGTDLHQTSSTNQHRNHRGTTGKTLRSANQFRVAMRAEEVDHRILRDLLFIIYRKTAIKAGESEPSMFQIERNRHPDGRVTIDVMFPVHQTVVTTGTTHLNGKDTLIRGDIDSIQPHRGLINDFLDPVLSHVREVVSVHDNDGPESAGAKAIDGLQGNQVVRGCFAWLDP